MRNPHKQNKHSRTFDYPGAANVATAHDSETIPFAVRNAQGITINRIAPHPQGASSNRNY